MAIHFEEGEHEWSVFIDGDPCEIFLWKTGEDYSYHKNRRAFDNPTEATFFYTGEDDDIDQVTSPQFWTFI